MVSLLRNGPRMLFVATSERAKLIDFLKREYEAEIMDLDAIFDKSDEFHSIIYVVKHLNHYVAKVDVTDAILIRRDVVTLLCQLMKIPDGGLIKAIRPAPQTIMMRSIGDMEKMLLQIQADFGGVIGTYDASIESSQETSTLIGLTQKPLNRSAKISDLYPYFLRLDADYSTLRRELKMHAINYFNSGLDNRVWNELEIRIYDSFGAYQVHYARLIEVFDSLELGIVLGESWSKDYPFILMSVEVYSLRFFTFLEPIEIKRILFGLEYLEDETRIVDYDVFVKNKKLYWRDLFMSKEKPDRVKESLKIRSEIYERLDTTTITELALLESKILTTRY